MTCPTCKGARLIINPELLAWSLTREGEPPALMSHEPCPRCGVPALSLRAALGETWWARLVLAARCAGQTAEELAAAVVIQQLQQAEDQAA